jgi:AcrR family transcriptional regulator
MTELPTKAPDELAPDGPADEVRARIVAAAARLLAAGGRDAATSRAVSAAAGVQAPTLYRHFGDMQGLLDAVAHEILAGYFLEKVTRARAGDPIDDLRRGWDLHVAFGLAHPEVYALVYGGRAAAAEAPRSRPAAREGEAHLQSLVTRAATAGRLRVSVPHAVRLIAAAGNGATLALLAAPPTARDLRLSHDLREAVLAAVTIAPANDGVPDDASEARSAARPAERVVARAVALRAVLADAALDGRPEVLSPAERHLLGDWLDRIANAQSPDAW